MHWGNKFHITIISVLGGRSLFLPGVQPQKSPGLRSWIPLWDQEEVAGGQCLCSEVDCTPQPSGSMCTPGWSDNKEVFCSGISQDWTRFRLGSAGGRTALGSLKAISPRKQGRTNWDSLQLPGPLDQALLDSRPWPCCCFPPPQFETLPSASLRGSCVVWMELPWASSPPWDLEHPQSTG